MPTAGSFIQGKEGILYLAINMDTAQLYDFFREAPLVCTDSRQVAADDFFIGLRGDRFDGNQFAAQALEQGAAYALVDDPEVVTSDRMILVPDTLAALQDLARFHRRQFDIPILAITGSNGKTTTKELLAAVLDSHYQVHVTKGNLNNHIGVPLTLLAMPTDAEIAVIEMGANHRGEIAALCRIAEPTHGLITNIGKAHLEGFGGEMGVRLGKGELYDFLRATNGTVFVNADERHLPEMAEGIKHAIYYRTSAEPVAGSAEFEIKPVELHPDIVLAFLGEEGKLIQVTTQLPGKHNFENLKTAVGVGKYFKVPSDKIARAIADYRSSNNRSERRRVGGIEFFLDAYNANPSSMEAALQTFHQMAGAPRAVILGSMLEMGEESEQVHEHIARLAMAQHYEAIILVGEGFEPVAQSSGLPYFATVEELKAWFWQQSWPGYHILIKGSRGIQLDRLIADINQTV